MLPSMEAAFFDLDKTVIAKASMVAFGRPLYRQGLISRRLLVRALYGQLVYMHLGANEAKLDRMRQSVLTLTKGWEQARVSSIVREALTDVVEPIIYREALDLIEEHRAAGRKVFIVSASPEEIVAPLGEFLGVDAAIASRARVEDGRYTGEMELYAYGPHKAVAMRRVAAEENIDLLRSWAYSDSATDIPMLETVGNPVAVNPDRGRSRAFVGDPPLRPPGPSARPRAGAARRADGGRRRHRARGGRSVVRVVEAAPPDRAAGAIDPVGPLRRSR